MQHRLGHCVAELVVVPAHQMLVEVLDREAGIAIAIELEHLRHLVDRHPPRRGAPDAPIVQTFQARVLVALSPAPKRALAHAQDLGRFQLAQRVALPAVENLLELHQSQSLQHARPSHNRPPVGAIKKTGQFTCYINRTYHALSTSRRPCLSPPRTFAVGWDSRKPSTRHSHVGRPQAIPCV